MWFLMKYTSKANFEILRIVGYVIYSSIVLSLNHKFNNIFITVTFSLAFGMKV